MRAGARKGQGGGGEWEGGATRRRKGVKGGRSDGLAAQRENTVGEQRGGSWLVRDAEGGVRERHSTEHKDFRPGSLNWLNSSDRVPLIGLPTGFL